MRKKILEWLFKKYVRDLKDSSRHQINLEMEAFKAGFDVKDLIRERLKGIRPNHPDDTSILQNHLSSLDDPSRLAFLLKAHDVVRNETFKVVLSSLMVESEHKAMLLSSDMEEVNFNRATVNGLMLVEEELESLSGMYLTEKETNKVMTDEERHAAL